jgi:hypothetical protein
MAIRPLYYLVDESFKSERPRNIYNIVNSTPKLLGQVAANIASRDDLTTATFAQQ